MASSSSRSTGSTRYASAPRCRPADRSATSMNVADTCTTGIDMSRRLMCSRMSNPLASGRLTSSTASSGNVVARMSNASAPVLASMTSNPARRSQRPNT